MKRAFKAAAAVIIYIAFVLLGAMQCIQCNLLSAKQTNKQTQELIEIVPSGVGRDQK